jgi:uncharacterized BrkB/YihY/UPF0761 family membrane protein
MMSVTGASRGLVDLVRDVLERYGRLGGSQLAAAIAYRALFSVVPLATFVATILAEVLSSSSADRRISSRRSPTSSISRRRERRTSSR